MWLVFRVESSCMHDVYLAFGWTADIEGREIYPVPRLTF